MSIDHRSHMGSGSNSPELKICKYHSNKPCDVSALQPCNYSEAEFILRLLQERANTQSIFELLIMTSWSWTYTLLPSTWTVRALGGYRLGKSSAIFQSMISAPIVDFQVSDLTTACQHMVRDNITLHWMRQDD